MRSSVDERPRQVTHYGTWSATSRKSFDCAPAHSTASGCRLWESWCRAWLMKGTTLAFNLGFTELLIDAETTRAAARPRAGSVEAIRAGKIVRNLLAFVRRPLQSGCYESQRRRQDDHLAAILEFGSANIRLFREHGEGMPSVIINPKRVSRYPNLILNAEQAMRTAHRGGTLTVTTKQVDERS